LLSGQWLLLTAAGRVALWATQYGNSRGRFCNCKIAQLHSSVYAGLRDQFAVTLYLRLGFSASAGLQLLVK
jgi:hypothetical protein